MVGDVHFVVLRYIFVSDCKFYSHEIWYTGSTVASRCTSLIFTSNSPSVDVTKTEKKGKHLNTLGRYHVY
jgi:hypothetical protein